MSFSSPSKVHIRKNWSKPLLKFLCKRLNSKLIYLGLPSQHAEDIEEWIEYISEVIAFQCREYPKPSNNNQDKNCIIELEKKLMTHKRQGKIDNFNVYDGYIEEVILKGADNDNKPFIQNDTIRIYNLDFCNSITSPIEFIDKNGNPKTAYKFDAVKKLLRMQSELDENNHNFVLFLTIHASFNGKELENFKNTEKILIKNCNQLRSTEKRKNILRLFVIKELERYYTLNNFVPHFLPTIDYKGINNANLLHFTIMGSKKNSGAGSAPWLQNINNLCDEDFIDINKNQINPVSCFSKSKTFKRFW